MKHIGFNDLALLQDVTRVSTLQQLLNNFLKRQEEISACLNALERINKGGFGHCVECHEEVELSYLRAEPTTAKCLRCQTKDDSSLSQIA